MRQGTLPVPWPLAPVSLSPVSCLLSSCLLSPMPCPLPPVPCLLDRFYFLAPTQPSLPLSFHGLHCLEDAAELIMLRSLHTGYEIGWRLQVPMRSCECWETWPRHERVDGLNPSQTPTCTPRNRP